MMLHILIKRPVTLLIHIAFAVIVVGGVVTWLTSRQGSVTVGKLAATNCLTLNSGDSINLPFAVKLSQFEVVNYPGTDSPMDYRCSVTVTTPEVVSGTLSMNNVFSYQHYRFYIHSYIPEADEVQLSVFFDPYGIAITYTGYALLLYALIIFFFDRRSNFRVLLSRFTHIK
ncbi:MAG: cytochrome c biogenesis protein ResB [Muribaculaceae bacterium]